MNHLVFSVACHLVAAFILSLAHTFFVMCRAFSLHSSSFLTIYCGFRWVFLSISFVLYFPHVILWSHYHHHYENSLIKIPIQMILPTGVTTNLHNLLFFFLILKIDKNEEIVYFDRLSSIVNILAVFFSFHFLIVAFLSILLVIDTMMRPAIKILFFSFMMEMIFLIQI